MATVKNKRELARWINDSFVQVAFAESGELYPEHPHKMKSMADSFTEVAFAELGEEYHSSVEETPPPKVCVKGETTGGICV